MSGLKNGLKNLELNSDNLICCNIFSFDKDLYTDDFL